MMDAYAPSVDPKTLALSRLVSTLAEDAIFGLSTGGGAEVLEGLGKRRGEAYAAVLTGHRITTMLGELDNWVVEMTRAMAPIHPPEWMPMSDVLRERVTLEAGARGLRSLFSSKPSDKDIQRVRRIGTLATRVLRAVFAADGALDAEETRTLASFIASLGLPDADAQPLFAEGSLPAEQLDVYGDVEPTISKALLRGAWLASAWDQIDPREEHVVRVVGNKLAVPPMELEVIRNEIVQRVDARRVMGLAAIDAVRFVLSDRSPGLGISLATKVGTLLIPRRYRDEALALASNGTRVTLTKRYSGMPNEDRAAVLGIAWAAALYDDPSLARRSLLRARHDRVAQDIGEDGVRARLTVEEWFTDVLAPAAFPLGAE